MSSFDDVKLNNLPPELCAKICDKLDGESAYELFKSCKQIQCALLSHAMHSATTITVEIKMNDHWSPVPINRPGNIVYSFQQFGIDPIEECQILNRRVTSILGELTNPNRRHTISFDFGVEIAIPLELFDGCRFLKLTGESYVVPEFAAVHGLILNNRINSYENINVPVLVINDASDILDRSSNIYIPDILEQTPFLPKLQHVESLGSLFFTELISKLPNIKPGFALYTVGEMFDDAIPASIYGARDVQAQGSVISRFQHLESAHITECITEHLENLNIRSFPPIVVPRADIRLPDVQYSILTRLVLSGEVGDLGVLNGSAITYLDIRECHNITRVYPDNRLDSFLCISTFTDFENLTNLRFFDIDYKIDQQHGKASHQKFLDTIGQMPSLQTLKLHNIILDTITIDIPTIDFRYVRSPVITTSATSINFSYTRIERLVATSECDITIDHSCSYYSLAGLSDSVKSGVFNMIDIYTPMIKSFTSTIVISSFRFLAITPICHLNAMIPLTLAMLVQLPNLEYLECSSISDNENRLCKIDSRFSKLTNLVILEQQQCIEVKKLMKSVEIVGSYHIPPVVVIINATCDILNTARSFDILGADVSVYTTCFSTTNMINPSVKINKLIIDLKEDMYDNMLNTDTDVMFSHLAENVNCNVLGFRYACVDSRFEVVKKVPVLYFEDCWFSEESSWSEDAKVIVKDCTFAYSTIGLPFYNARSGLRLNSHVQSEF